LFLPQGGSPATMIRRYLSVLLNKTSLLFFLFLKGKEEMKLEKRVFPVVPPTKISLIFSKDIDHGLTMGSPVVSLGVEIIPTQLAKATNMSSFCEMLETNTTAPSKRVFVVLEGGR